MDGCLCGFFFFLLKKNTVMQKLSYFELEAENDSEDKEEDALINTT
jgi:hypothetical protein